MGVKQTYKKQRLVGLTEVYDKDGNPIPSQLIKIEDKDFNFHKVWLQHLILSFEGITNQRLKLASWILDNLDTENQLVMTQRKISEKSGMSLATVMRTMTELQKGELPFLQKINSGAYRVNPAVIWKGSYNKRMSVLFDYTSTDRDNKDNNKDKQMNDDKDQITLDEGIL